MIWPPYIVGAQEKGVLTERQARQVRASYGGKLTMIDAWLGGVLDAIEAKGLWDDTLVILCTDHGHYLGEKDIWGKPGAPLYQPMAHIPMLIAAPGLAAQDCGALTTSVDLFATLQETFGIETVRQRTHGRSLLPLLRGESGSVRDHLLAGVWGREVHLIEKTRKYVRAPKDKNAPLAMFSNRWSTMPTHVLERSQELPLPDHRAVLDKMPGSAVPVLRQIWEAGDAVPYWAAARFRGNQLYDLENDPNEEDNLAESDQEAASAERLRIALEAVEAPAAQFQRLGL